MASGRDLGGSLIEWCFDRDLTLSELLTGVDGDRLLAALKVLLAGPLRLVDTTDQVLLGSEVPAAARRVVIKGELEPLGYLEALATEDALRAAAQLLELILRGAARYQMASDLHLEAVSEDYRELQRRHDALQASEARYRALTATLEQQVASQVQTIDNARRQLYQSEKLAAVGQLAAGVAHEINNPIGFISSNLSSALGYLTKLGGFSESLAAHETSPLRTVWREADLDYVLKDFAALMQESLDGARRVTRIVADLKGFSRVDNAAIAPADVNEIIRGVCNVSRGQTEGRVELVLELAPLPVLECNAAALGQVFYNLLSNAVQAMEGQPAARLRIATLQREQGIVITLADNGPGIPAEVLPRIFDPFFTTKDVGQGTGLGLTVCTDVVHAHKGRITVQTRQGAGTEFTVYLPLPD